MFRSMLGNADSSIGKIFACGIRNPRLGSGIQNSAQGIKNPANDWNPQSKVQNPESRIHNPGLSWITLNEVK